MAEVEKRYEMEVNTYQGKLNKVGGELGTRFESQNFRKNSSEFRKKNDFERLKRQSNGRYEATLDRVQKPDECQTFA